ncbi:uncharacterized protein VTP21DRAFT_7283 [Calcarisporiella thermophila]|uniref:uncharacterized protein n=1 Tax=Calcarisporiella thermophila TaxID=911321 RepID=UPI003742BE65
MYKKGLPIEVAEEMLSNSSHSFSCKEKYRLFCEREKNWKKGIATSIKSILASDFISIRSYAIHEKYLAGITIENKIYIWDLWEVEFKTWQNTPRCIDFIDIGRFSSREYIHIALTSTQDSPYLIAISGDDGCLVVGPNGVVLYTFEFEQVLVLHNLYMNEKYIALWFDGASFRVWRLTDGSIAWEETHDAPSGYFGLADSILFVLIRPYNIMTFTEVVVVDLVSSQRIKTISSPLFRSLSTLCEVSMRRNLLVIWDRHRAYSFLLSREYMEEYIEFPFESKARIVYSRVERCMILLAIFQIL